MCTKKKKETGHTKKVADITFGGVKREPPLSFVRAIVPGDKVKGGDEGFLPGEGKGEKKFPPTEEEDPFLLEGGVFCHRQKEELPSAVLGGAVSLEEYRRPPPTPPNKKSFGEAPTEFVALSRQQKEKISVGPAKIEGGLRSRWSTPQRDSYGLRNKRILFRKTR